MACLVAAALVAFDPIGSARLGQGAALAHAATASSPQSILENRGLTYKATAQKALAGQKWLTLFAVGTAWTESLPKDAEAWEALGIAANNLEQQHLALNSLEKAVKLDPRLYLAWLNLAAVQVRQGQPAQALQSYRHILRSNPSDERPFAGAGVAAANLGDYAEAQGLFQRAVEIAPKDAASWHRLGIAQRALHHQQAAIDAFGNAVALAPKDMEAWFLLGQTYYETGQDGQARDLFDRILPLNAYYADQYSERFLNPTLDRLKRPGLDSPALTPTAKAWLLAAEAGQGARDALAVLKDAASRDEPAANYGLALYQRDTQHDKAAADRLFHAAATRGSISAAVSLAEPYIAAASANDATITATFLQSAATDNANEASLLALGYAKGNAGFPRDAALNAFWRARAESSIAAWDDTPVEDDETPPPLSTFEKGIGKASLPIVTSMLYAGVKAGNPALSSDALVAGVTQAGFAHLDNTRLRIALRLRAALTEETEGPACAALWTGVNSPQIQAVINSLPSDQQAAWAGLFAATARAALTAKPIVLPSAAQIAAATSRLIREMTPAEAGAITAASDYSVAANPIAACGAARATYNALLKVSDQDAFVILRSSMLH